MDMRILTGKVKHFLEMIDIVGRICRRASFGRQTQCCLGKLHDHKLIIIIWTDLRFFISPKTTRYYSSCASGLILQIKYIFHVIKLACSSFDAAILSQTKVSKSATNPLAAPLDFGLFVLVVMKTHTPHNIGEINDTTDGESRLAHILQQISYMDTFCSFYVLLLKPVARQPQLKSTIEF